MLLKLEQELEKEIEMEKKWQRTIWARSWSARRKEVEDCSTFSATQFFVARQKVAKGGRQFHPQLVSSALRCRL